MADFADVNKTDYFAFVQQNPLAWIVPHSRPEQAILMPVLFENADCKSLFGHLPLHAPIVEAVRENPEITCLFLGPHSYIPPEWVDNDGWVPTWNFISVKITGSTTLSAKLTRSAVERLVEHMQKDSHSDWTIDKVEQRMDDLLPKIIGFTLSSVSIVPRFKLGQDETLQSLERIKTGLGEHPLSKWVR